MFIIAQLLVKKSHFVAVVSIFGTTALNNCTYGFYMKTIPHTPKTGHVSQLFHFSPEKERYQFRDHKK